MASFNSNNTAVPLKMFSRLSKTPLISPRPLSHSRHALSLATTERFIFHNGGWRTVYKFDPRVRFVAFREFRKERLRRSLGDNFARKFGDESIRTPFANRERERAGVRIAKPVDGGGGRLELG